MWWVTGRVASFCNLDVTGVSEFGSGVNSRVLGFVAGAEEVSDSNMITNEIPKALNKRIYTDHNLDTSMNDSEIIT